MDMTSPYACDKRFPPRGYYVCEMLDDWQRKFQQLCGSLCFVDHTKDGKTKDLPHSVFVDANDAHNSFNNATSAMLD